MKKDDRNGKGKIPVYGSNGIVGYHDEALIDSPAVIVGRKGSAGVVNLSSGPSWPIDVTYFVKPYGGMSLKFASFILIAAKLTNLNRATAIPGLNRDDAYGVEVVLPPLEEQERIVARVDELMELCDQLETKLSSQGELADEYVAASAHALVS